MAPSPRFLFEAGLLLPVQSATRDITFDRYGHLMPGSETEVVRAFDDYLARSAEPTSPKVGTCASQGTPQSWPA